MNYFEFVITDLSTGETETITLDSGNTTFVHKYSVGNLKNDFIISFTEKLKNLDSSEGLAKVAESLSRYTDTHLSLSVSLYNTEDVIHSESDETETVLMYNIVIIDPVERIHFQGRQNDPFGKERYMLPFARDLEIG